MAVSVRYTVYLLVCIVLLLTLHTSFLDCKDLPEVSWLSLHQYWQSHRCQKDSYIVSSFESIKAEKANKVQDPEKIWEEINARRALIWHPCYIHLGIHYQCARLLVPLNYSAPISPSNHASIALIRIPSPYPRFSKQYKGPILFNPGGPGGSGVDLILRVGKLLRAIVGNGYDVVSFDPRGISRSRPFVSAFASPIDRFTYLSRLSVFALVNTSTDSIPESVAGIQVMNQLLEISGRSYLEFINTDHTARDMLSIVKAHGRDKLYYWGFSYGTILGATFASIFPDNVGRIIIDGVVDAEDYYSTSWTLNLIDTDKVLQSFFTACHNAGPSHCSFYAPTPEAISQNLTKIYESIKSNPIPFVFASETGKSIQYGVIDYNLLRHLIFQSLYQPYTWFPYLADVLTSLAKGIPPPPPPFLTGGGRLFTNENRFGKDGLDLRDRVGEAQGAILCNDGKPIPGTVEDTVAHYEELKKLSEWADVWTVRSLCLGWPDLPKHFQGPITANTSYPLLLIGNTADPVTPLAGAKKMSKAFPGSVVLTQDSPGHCSVSGPSVCTMKYVRAYLDDGTLPEEGTVCPVLGPPIPGISFTSARDGQVVFEGLVSDQDRELAAAVVELSETYSLPRFL